jgi:hypothetical protein
MTPWIQDTWHFCWVRPVYDDKAQIDKKKNLDDLNKVHGKNCLSWM